MNTGDKIVFKAVLHDRCTVNDIGEYIRQEGNLHKVKNQGKTFYVLAEYIELLPSDATIINSVNQTMPTNKKTVCEINFTRQAGEQLLFIKSTKEIAELFKSPEGVSTSENYKDKDGNKLKYQKEIPELANFVSKFRSQSYSSAVKLDRYGTNLIVDGCYNFSILRTKGISDGITVKVGDLILENDVTNWIQALGSFLKFLHRNYIDRVEVKATIAMDL